VADREDLGAPARRPPLHTLFLCTGNSARSILAEALLREMGGERFVAHSAGSHPTGRVHPLALELLANRGLPVDGLRSKSWDEFARPQAPALDLVITVCDNAAGEVCPVWPGHPATAHWGLPDPAAVTGDVAQRRVFAEVAHALSARIRLLTSLPVDRLDRMSLQRNLRAIATPDADAA
jgi:arsenate reductase